MRLYLSSYGLGDHADRLLALVGEARRLFVVPNALDAASPHLRRARVAEQAGALAALGLVGDVLDLTDAHAPSRLGDASLVWVLGGNVFVLRKALAASGADRRLLALLADDALVYAGYSAGACVLAPSLRGLEGVDDPGLVTDPVFDGLGVLDRPVVPHVDSPAHPESARCESVAAAYEAGGTTPWRLRDGDVLVVEQHHYELIRRRDQSVDRARVVSAQAR